MHDDIFQVLKLKVNKLFHMYELFLKITFIQK